MGSHVWVSGLGLGLGLGASVKEALGLGFKYISMILKGCEQTLNSVDSAFTIVSVLICICSPTFPVLSNNDSTQRECAQTNILKLTRLSTAMGPTYSPTKHI